MGEEGNPDSLLNATLPHLHLGGQVDATELESQQRTAKRAAGQLPSSLATERVTYGFLTALHDFSPLHLGSASPSREHLPPHFLQLRNTYASLKLKPSNAVPSVKTFWTLPSGQTGCCHPVSHTEPRTSFGSSTDCPQSMYSIAYLTSPRTCQNAGFLRAEVTLYPHCRHSPWHVVDASWKKGWGRRGHRGADEATRRCVF